MQGIKGLKSFRNKKQEQNDYVGYLFLKEIWRQKFLVDLGLNQKSSLNWLYFY